jgi:hypothetical protein
MLRWTGVNDFPERLMIAVIPSLISVLGGTLVIGWWIQRIARGAQDRRDQFRLRHELVAQINEAANALHFPLEEYFRAKQDENAKDMEVQRKVFEDQYLKTRVMGEILESRLELYFPNGAPWRYWHKTKDLLLVRRLHALGRGEKAIGRKVGAGHTEMTLEHLMDIDVVKQEYRKSLKYCIRAVLTEPLSYPV